MTLTVRLDAALEEQLENYCQAEGATKSAVVTQALRDFLSVLRQRRTPYEIYQEVMAEAGTPALDDDEVTDHSAHYKQRLREKLRAKYGR